MIRFRFSEDEKRYLSLLSEVYRIVGSNLPPREMMVVMRNLGKLQDILLLEGVRQGAAAAGIAECMFHREEEDDAPYRMRPFQLHAAIYGANDTPLHDVEREHLKRMDIVADEINWVDPEPMRFAPDTEQAALVERTKSSLQEARSRAKRSWDDWDEGDVAQEVAPDDIHIDDLLAKFESDEAFERPDTLDRIRDVLLDMAKSQIKPDSWQELILRVSRATHIDAGFVDLQLGTEMGRTVLAQAGMADIVPGVLGVDLSSATAGVVPLTAEELQRRMQSGDD